MRDDWEKPRSKGQHLTEAEIAQIRVAFRCGRKPEDIARELKCSSRVAAKYFAQFRGNGRHISPKIIIRPRPQPAVAAKSRFYKSNFEL
jgi:hypothetical protein